MPEIATMLFPTVSFNCLKNKETEINEEPKTEEPQRTSHLRQDDC